MTDETFETFDVFECLGWTWLSTGIIEQSKKTEQQSDEKIPYLNDLTEHLDVQQNISNVLNRVAQLNHVVYSPI